jgi:hypothetical protein
MFNWCNSIGLIALFGWLLFPNAATLSLGKEQRTNISAETSLANFPDGAYQLCTQPLPQDWPDGTGVCFNYVKKGTTIDGYYGYPHSGDFVCLRGKVSKDWLYGEGMIISWGEGTGLEIPQKKFTWDKEGRLSLSQGDSHSNGIGEDRLDWIIFKQAKLNAQGLYLYPNPRMKSPTQLCDWSL